MRTLSSSAPRWLLSPAGTDLLTFPSPAGTPAGTSPSWSFSRQSRDAVLSSPTSHPHHTAQSWGQELCEASASHLSLLSPLSFSRNTGTRLVMSPRHQAHFYPQLPDFQLPPAPGQKELDPFHPVRTRSALTCGTRTNPAAQINSTGSTSSPALL